MARRSVRFLLVLSVFCTFVLALLWTISYWRTDEFSYSWGTYRAGRTTGLGLKFYPGVLRFEAWVVDAPGPVDGHSSWFNHSSYDARPELPVDLCELFSGWYNVRRFGGFGFEHRVKDPLSGLSFGPGPNTLTGWLFEVPHWFPVAVLLIPLAVWANRRRVRDGRLRRGLCPECGYDLRASTERCPECGGPWPAVPPDAKGSASGSSGKRVKVVPCLPDWSRLLGLLALALLIRVHLAALEAMIGNWFHDPATLALAAIMLILLPVMLSFQEQRPRRAIAEAIVLGSGAMLHKDMLVSLGHGRWEMILTLLNMCAAGSIVLIVVRLLALRVVLFVGPRLVVQTGSLCWTCARDLSGNVSGSCPDCGGRVPHHSEVWDARRRRPGRGWRFVMLCVLGSSAYILLARIAEVPWPRSYFRESYIDLCCLLIFVPSLVLLWLERRRVFPRHRCQKCGYDLTGNVSGVCPECGRVVSAGKTEVTKAIPTASETK